MKRRDYKIFTQGYDDALNGAGLSDSPYGGLDGYLWRRGVQSRLDEASNHDKGTNEKHDSRPARKVTR